MRVRVRETLGEEQASRIALGTFHSICARMLRWHGDALPGVVPGLDGRFSIFDTDDSRRLLAEILKEEGVDSAEVCDAQFIATGLLFRACLHFDRLTFTPKPNFP